MGLCWIVHRIYSRLLFALQGSKGAHLAVCIFLDAVHERWWKSLQGGETLPFLATKLDMFGGKYFCNLWWDK